MDRFVRSEIFCNDVASALRNLHIDLLPQAQGRGLGRQLIERFLAALRAGGVPSVHLGVGERNAGAIAFYERLGFHLLGTDPGWRAYGLKLA